jgi:outer membrane protein assembly factor BamA
LAFVAAAIASSSLPIAAHGDNPLNSNEKPGSSTTEAQSPRGKNDFTIVPVVGGSTDVGIGGGFFAGLTRNRKGYDPFVWNLEAAWIVTFMVQEKKFKIPYDDGYAKLTVTRLFGLPLQLDVRPSFTDEETLYYYGMGNASSPRGQASTSNPYFQYGRIHPSLLLVLGFKISDHVAGELGFRYTGSDLHVAGNSRLADDLKNGSPEVRRLIGPTAGYQSVALYRYGVRFDTRDNETSPHSGTWDEIAVQASPGDIDGLPYRYAQASVELRGFVPAGKRITLAARAVGDVIVGDPPFAELPRFGDTYAVGGSNGVRGVPAQRYYGKVKVFGNLEVRARLFPFKLFGKPLQLGSAVFLDAGRVWADTSPHPELDGTSIGIKYGIGAGLRLLSGTAFVLRADVAWSPDATPIGAYVAAGEMF